MAATRVIAGRYRLDAPLGEGGMGEVFRGTDLRTGAAVAVKQLRAELLAGGEDQLRRFEREAEALRRLNHPSIVQMLATVNDGGRPYIVMEYVPGGSLAELLQQQPRLPVQRTLQIALDLSDALARAHRLRIIHRDLKPANVLLAADGTPRLTDFGVAHMADDATLTQAGMLIGTYAYLSPEACHGQILDERADLWSFGVMLFEMLTGRLPFDGDQPGAILTAILTRPTPDLRLFRPDVSPGLAALVGRMLEKNRDRRIASARSVGAAIEALLRGDQPVLDDWGPPAEGDTIALPRTPAPAPLTPAYGATPALANAATSPVEAPATPASTRPARPSPALLTSQPRWLWAGLATGLALIAAIVALRLASARPEGALIASVPTAAVETPRRSVSTATPAPTASPAPALVEPVAAGQYMVLVAQFEPLDATRRDVARAVVESLRQSLEEDAPFSHLRVRAYPQIIASEADAQRAASANKAPVIIWGSYGAGGVEAAVQLGDTGLFPQNQIPLATLQRTANVRVTLADERKQSLAAPVLTALNVLRNADGDGYELLRALATLQQINVTSGTIEGNGVAAQLNRYMVLYFDDTPKAIELIDAAIALDGGNPLLYNYRSAANQRLGHTEDARRDARTSQSLGPPGWTSPGYQVGVSAFLTGNYTDTLHAFDAIVERRPNDWFPATFRGAMRYMGGQIGPAKADLEHAVALGPDANFPYVFLTLIALREGRVDDARALTQTILRAFPDPSYAARILTAFYGPNVPNMFGPTFAAFGNLTLGQYESAATNAQAAIAQNPQLADLYFMQGFAACNLHRNEEAEVAYSRGLELAPDFALLHLLRAEVRLKQGNSDGALEDLGAAQQSPQAPLLAPLIAAAQEGKGGCETFLSGAP